MPNTLKIDSIVKLQVLRYTFLTGSEFALLNHLIIVLMISAICSIRFISITNANLGF